MASDEWGGTGLRGAARAAPPARVEVPGHLARTIRVAAVALALAGCAGSNAPPSIPGTPPVCDPAPWSGDETPRVRAPFDDPEDPAVAAVGLTAVPTLLNEAEVQSTIVEAFSPVLLEEEPVPAGVVRFWLMVDAGGGVRAIEFAEYSGSEALDEAAHRVARTVRLTPAVRGRCRVPVWVSYPVRFEGGSGGRA